MAKINIRTDKCARCLKELPIIDEEGNPNFFRIGAVGFGSATEYVCGDCKKLDQNKKTATSHALDS